MSDVPSGTWPSWLFALSLLAVVWPAFVVLAFMYTGRRTLRRKLPFLLVSSGASYGSCLVINEWTRGFDSLSLLFVTSVALPTAVAYAAFRYFSANNAKWYRWEARLRLGRVSPRFWLGVVLPTITLTLFVVLVMVTGQGTGFAAGILFFASFVTIPGVAVLNCWVLFVGWKTSRRLLLGSTVLPALVGLAAVLLVHGTGRGQELGLLLLAPFLLVPIDGPGRPQAAVALWALAMIILIVAARIVSERKAARAGYLEH